MKIAISRKFFEKYGLNFMKIHLVEAELFHADKQTEGQTDRQYEAISRFSKFCERA